MRTVFHEFLMFGLKMAWACLFGGLLLFFILLTQYWYPFEGLHRYDFLFLVAVCIQFGLLAFRLETKQEAVAVILFHLVATAMELFKTHESIGSWVYPGHDQAFFVVANVPLFTGFMYSAVGSFICRAWRLFDMRYEPFPRFGWIALLGVLIYLNFFSHHFLPDIRWLLLAFSILLFWQTKISFTPHRRTFTMPFNLSQLLTAFFIWIAENVSTWGKAWLYPDQHSGWQLVSPSKLVAWYLLLMISFALVVWIQRNNPRWGK